MKRGIDGRSVGEKEQRGSCWQNSRARGTNRSRRTGGGQTITCRNTELTAFILSGEVPRVPTLPPAGSTLNSYLSVPLHRVNCQSRSSARGTAFLRMHVRLHGGRDDQIRVVGNPLGAALPLSPRLATRPRLEHAAKSSRLRTDRNSLRAHMEINSQHCSPAFHWTRCISIEIPVTLLGVRTFCCTKLATIWRARTAFHANANYR